MPLWPYSVLPAHESRLLRYYHYCDNKEDENTIYAVVRTMEVILVVTGMAPLRMKLPSVELKETLN